MYIARDSVDPFAIPLTGLSVVMGYGDGTVSQWSSDGWARFQPPIVVLSIVVNYLDNGDILDVETGDANPAQVPSWRNNFNRLNRRRPSVYCNRLTWSQVFSLVGNTVDYWIATLDGTTDVEAYRPSGCTTLVAVQYKGSGLTGGNYDESVIVDPSWVGLGGTMTQVGLDPTDPTVNDIQTNTDVLHRLYATNGTPGDISSRTVLDLIESIFNDVEALVARSATNIDIPILAQDIANDLLPKLPPQTDPNVIASAVMTALRNQINK